MLPEYHAFYTIYSGMSAEPNLITLHNILTKKIKSWYL